MPTYCNPAELAGIEEQLAKTTDPAARNLLLAKKQDAENAEQQCAADAAAHPAGKKPNSVGILVATTAPGPTATLQVGIQDAHLNRRIHVDLREQYSFVPHPITD